MKIASIVGARPQFIKAAPVDKKLQGRHQHILIHTGQHYDYLMSAVFFDELHIPEPDFNLEVGSATHGRQTGDMLIRLEETLSQERPDWVLVYGDTNSTLAGALAAAKLHLAVAHVEAGLRSYNREMPEEINRVVADHLAQLLLCPTETAVDNLAQEGITQGVFNVGDVMCDALLQNLEGVDRRSHVLDSLSVRPRNYLLATIHRPSNTDDLDNLSEILAAFSESGESVLFPAHPRTSQAMARAGLQPPSTVRLLEPLSYVDMLVLERNARLILTDSGGVQKEAYLLGVPCLTLREETEWVETVETGWNLLVGSSKDRIARAVREFRPQENRPQVFGDGEASRKIVDLLESM
jgi:UDP-GlcNAc3NAcA epimerase